MSRRVVSVLLTVRGGDRSPIGPSRENARVTLRRVDEVCLCTGAGHSETDSGLPDRDVLRGQSDIFCGNYKISRDKTARAGIEPSSQSRSGEESWQSNVGSRSGRRSASAMQ